MPEMTLFEEKQMRIESGELAVTLAFKRLGLVKDDLSQREAYRIFGEAQINSLVNEKLLNKVKTGDRNSKVYYSRIEIETILNLKAKRKLK
jgi:hypothetical protein